MMKPINQALYRIADVWQEDRAEFFTFLQSGISYEKFQSYSSHYSLRFSWELYELYQWRNGLNKPDLPSFATEFIPGFDFPPFEEAIENFHQLEEYRQQITSSIEKNARRPWFPVFSIDIQHLIVFGDIDSSKTSPVYYLSTDCDNSLQMIYPDLTSLLSVAAECFETGAYYYETQVVDKYGHTIELLVEDDQEVSQVKQRLLDIV